MKNRNFFFLLGTLALVPACEKNPVDKLTNPLPNGSVPRSSGIYPIYHDELETGGGLGFIPGGENQVIDLFDNSSPRQTARQIRYTWNGGDVSDAEHSTTAHTFAGFSLLVTPNFSTLSAAPAKDLSTAGYTKLTLLLRGSLSTGTKLRVEGPSDGTATPARQELDAAQISQAWQLVTVAVPPSDFSNIKTFATISIQYTQPPRTTNPGEGGTIYVTQIQYER